MEKSAGLGVDAVDIATGRARVVKPEMALSG